MSYRKVIPALALVAFALPGAALADGIQFGFENGNLNVARPFEVGSVASSSEGVTLRSLSLFSGSASLGAVVTFGFLGPHDSVGNIEGSYASVAAPEPGTFELFGTGLMGVAGILRRRISRRGLRAEDRYWYTLDLL